MRYKITISYDGAPFCGWQIQPNAPSVQGALQDALEKLLGHPTPVTGAGRTDTGVNAIHYAAHFDLPSRIPDPGQLRYRLNAILPAAISVESVEPAPDNFHARFDAKRREYTYFIHRRKDPFAAKSFFCGWPELDFEEMNKACRVLLGEHDFSCFEKNGADNKTSICTVFEAGWHKTDEDHWYFRIAADRFLRNMVRAIVGTLLEVGRGKRKAEDTDALIRSGDRCEAGESVPGNALFLTNIEYE